MHIGVRANIHLGGGRPSFARMDSVGGGLVAEMFRDPYSRGGVVAEIFRDPYFVGYEFFFPLTAVRGFAKIKKFQK